MKLPQRTENSHKGTYGRVAVFGGSAGMAGSVCMAAIAALKIGAGYSYAVVPEEIFDICQIKLTEVIVKKDSDPKAVFEMADSVVVGPGYLSKNGVRHIMEIAQHSSKPMVVDAEGLKYIKENKFINKNCVITPHSGEFADMLSIESPAVLENREYFSQKYAYDNNLIVLLKGKNTVIASPNGETVINKTGGSELSTAGSGDVLSGIIGGLMAQGLPPFEAAVTGAHIHGLAGDLAGKDMSAYSVTAADILNYIGKAVLECI